MDEEEEEEEGEEVRRTKVCEKLWYSCVSPT